MMNLLRSMSFVVSLCTAMPAVAAPLPADSVDFPVPPGFHSEYRVIDGVRMHYVTGGSGPLVYLVHGFGETWYKWHDLMPLLANKFKVVAPDIPGLGQSDASKASYAAQDIANYLYDLAKSFSPRGKFDVVAHDIGVWNTYPMIVEHQSEIRRVIYIEAPIPDDSLYQYPAFAPSGESLVWHFSFFGAKDNLAENLIGGNERIFFNHFFRIHTGSAGNMTAREIGQYADAIAAKGRLHASMAYYQDLPETIRRDTPLERQKLTMPILAIGGGDSFGWGEVSQISKYGTDVYGASISGCGHWLPEECSDATLPLITRFLDSKVLPKTLIQ
jgi:pimeloyl-ACP methyl ester carboxylesterase